MTEVHTNTQSHTRTRTTQPCAAPVLVSVRPLFSLHAHRRERNKNKKHVTEITRSRISLRDARTRHRERGKSLSKRVRTHNNTTPVPPLVSIVRRRNNNDDDEENDNNDVTDETRYEERRVEEKRRKVSRVLDASDGLVISATAAASAQRRPIRPVVRLPSRAAARSTRRSPSATNDAIDQGVVLMRPVPGTLSCAVARLHARKVNIHKSTHYAYVRPGAVWPG